MVMPNMKEGMKEYVRSFSKQAFLKSLQRLIPELTEKDFIPTHAKLIHLLFFSSGQLV
jgi:L-2-hydroxyglutarate oxidase